MRPTPTSIVFLLPPTPSFPEGEQPWEGDWVMDYETLPNPPCEGGRLGGEL